MKIDTAYHGSFSAVADAIEEGVRDAVERCANDILNDALANCPEKSGDLKNSLQVEVGDTKAEIYSDLPYAQNVETGDTKNAPNPFLSKALYENEDSLMDELTDALREQTR